MNDFTLLFRLISLSLLSKSAIHANILVEYQASILACLQDHDISIRRQASHLALKLCNEENIQEVMDCLLEMSDQELYESMERVSMEQSHGEYYVSFVVKLLGLIDNDRDTFGEERSEAMVARVCRAIKKKGLLSIAITKMIPKAGEDNKVCIRKAATWCCGEFYTFADDVKKGIASFLRDIQNKPDPYLLIALAKLPREDELTKGLVPLIKNVEGVEARTMKSVIWAAMKADPALILFDVTPQEDAVVPLTSTADILAAYDKPVTPPNPTEIDIVDADQLFGDEVQAFESQPVHKSPEGEKDPFDFW